MSGTRAVIASAESVMMSTRSVIPSAARDLLDRARTESRFRAKPTRSLAALGMTEGFGMMGALVITVVFSLTSCRKDHVDAYGNFEATEVTVAAETGGRLLSFAVEEGDRLAKDSVIGVVDTVPLLLERQALVARRAAAAARTRESGANIAALEVQRSIADRELARTERLLKQAAATAQQGDPRRARRATRARAARRGAGGARVGSPGGRGARGAGRLHRREARLAAGSASPLPAPCWPATSKPASSCRRASRSSSWPRSTRSRSAAYVSNSQLTQLRLGQQVQVGVDRADSIASAARAGHLDRLRGGVHAHADPDARRARRPGVRGEGAGGQSRRPAPDRYARRADHRAAAGRRDD